MEQHKMAQPPEELEQSLVKFRLDVINALSEINVEITALQQLLAAHQLVTQEQLSQARTQARRALCKAQARYDQDISPAHKLLKLQ